MTSVETLNTFGRIQLSETFYMRDFLYSEIAHAHGILNLPDDQDLAVQAGTAICTTLLEPLQNYFGRLAIRSAFLSHKVNDFGNQRMREGKSGYNCSASPTNYAAHIWDRKDQNGHMGATVCLVIPKFAALYNQGTPWSELAWWIHDHLPYSSLYFFPTNAAFNLTWSQAPMRRIDSYAPPKGTLTKAGMDNHTGRHSTHYPTITRIFGDFEGGRSGEE